MNIIKNTLITFILITAQSCNSNDIRAVGEAIETIKCSDVTLPELDKCKKENRNKSSFPYSENYKSL